MRQRIPLLILVLAVFNIEHTRSHVVSNSTDSGFEVYEIFTNQTEKTTSYFLEIDLASCKCWQNSEECEIAISKSTILEIQCSLDEIYCCSGKKTKSSAMDTTLERNDDLDDLLTSPIKDAGIADSAVSATIRLLVANNPYEKNDNDNNSTETDDKAIGGEASIKNVPKKCLCKAREQCSEQNIDYRFGFHCNYNTIRCCEPENEILKDMKEEGRLIIPDISEISRSNLEDSETNSKCYCLPREKCTREDENVIIWRRQDTLCPGDLVQCCGENLLLNEKMDHNNGDTAETLVQGGLLYPIQLPELKIPMTEEIPEEILVATTMAPPQLPTHYNYQPPKYYSGYYSPDHINPPAQFVPDPRPDFGHVKNPWSRDSYEDSSALIGNHRGIHRPYPIEDPRSFNPKTSMFDKLASILG